MTVVCDGVTSDILPELDDSKVPAFHTGPIGPHPVGSFEIWTPREYLPEMLSFMMYHRGDISVLFHPLGVGELIDHTRDAMWLGPSYPIGNKLNGSSIYFIESLSTPHSLLSDLSVFSSSGGDSAQYPELGLGYSNNE